MYVVSMMTAAPSKAMQDFVDACRRPKGKTIMEEKTA
jgi:cation/acetate symporter